MAASKAASRKSGAKSATRKKSGAGKSGRQATPKKSSRTTKAARSNATRTSSSNRWSQHVTETSDALDLKQGVFTLRDPKKIAASLKRSAEHSSRRKANPYRSALSMLTFYINRAGKTLPKTQHARLDQAKDELKHLFARD
jgi:hypothetical protein